MSLCDCPSYYAKEEEFALVDFCPVHGQREYRYLDWVTRAGERVQVVDMTDEHVRNALAMLERDNPDHPYVEVLREELRHREAGG